MHAQTGIRRRFLILNRVGASQSAALRTQKNSFACTHEAGTIRATVGKAHMPHALGGYEEDMFLTLVSICGGCLACTALWKRISSVGNRLKR